MNRLTIALAATALTATAASAQVKLDGQLTALKDCDAVISIKKGTNPDQATIVAGKSYRLLGQNSNNPTHYWIEVPDAEPKQRWVSLDCGSTDGKSAATPAPAPLPMPSTKSVNTDKGTVKQKPASRGFGGREPYYAFALSWEPTFCSNMRDKTECRAETPASWEATHFTIHGLWPQPMRNQYCGVTPDQTALDDQHQWDALPEPQISPQTRAALNIAMPGTMSNLQRHEWIKHGTCYPAGNAEQYFKDEMRLAAEVNNSPIRELVTSFMGKRIPSQLIHAAFDKAFGAGAGSHVQVECDKQGRFAGFTMNLRGDIPGGANLQTLLQAGDPIRDKCDGGVVTAVR